MQGNALADTVIISKPLAGMAEQYDILPGGIYQFEFDPGLADLSALDTDLQFRFDDGAIVSLKNFRSAAEKEDVTILLADGVGLSGRDLFGMLDMNLQDFRTETSVVAFLPDAEGDGPVPSGDGPAGQDSDFASLIESAGAGMAPLCQSVCDISLEHPLSKLPMAPLPPDLVEEAHKTAEDSEEAKLAARQPGPEEAGGDLTPGQEAHQAAAPFAPPPYSLMPRITQSSLLRVEDVLDTTQPVPGIPGCQENGAFLFEPLQDIPPPTPLPLTAGIVDPLGPVRTGEDAADPLLLAFFRLGSG